MISRRKFIAQAATAATAFTILPRFVLGGKGFIAPSDTLYIAGVGVGGKGTSDLIGFAANPKAKIAFLCDVDDRQAADSVKNFPSAKISKDFRELLDKQKKNLHAVSLPTPSPT